MFNLKALSSRIRVPANKMVKDLTIKHRRKLFCKYDGVWYQFPSVNEVIIPYKQAKDYALLAHKNLPNPVDVNELNYDHLLDVTKDKIPAVVLLGHFNHGKTTLLDTLGGTTFVDEEKHSITQVLYATGNVSPFLQLIRSWDILNTDYSHHAGVHVRN